MEHLTERQAQNYLRKIAKSLGLKLKFETLGLRFYRTLNCTIKNDQSALLSGSMNDNTNETRDFDSRLQSFLKNKEVQALRKKFYIIGLDSNFYIKAD